MLLAQTSGLEGAFFGSAPGEVVESPCRALFASSEH